MTTENLKKYLEKEYPRTSSFLSGLSLFIIDGFVLTFCFALGFFIVNVIAPSHINFRSVINYFYFIPLILVIFSFEGLYPGIMISPTEQVKKFSISVFIAITAMIVGIFIADINDYDYATFFLQDSGDKAVSLALFLIFPLATIALPAFREFFKTIFAKFRWWGVPAVIYNTNKSAEFIVKKLIHRRYLGYHPAIIIDSSITEPYDFEGIPVFPEDMEVLKTIRQHNIKTAVICDYTGDMSHIMTGYRYTITVSKRQTNFTLNQQLKDIDGIIAFSSIHNLTFNSNRLLKRLLDLSIILVLSPFWVPVFVLLMFLTKITSRGPVFYGHKRVGKNGKEIKCWKFRSMVINSQEILEKILAEDPVRRAEWEKDRKFTDDPRVTKFGKILRKTSLDELPQLINVIVGEMSLVGPRPVTLPELDKYGKYKDYVLSVTPGLSGMWQISGRSDTGYEERISYDTYYIQNWSLWLDIWILIKSVWVVIVGKGAY